MRREREERRSVMRIYPISDLCLTEDRPERQDSKGNEIDTEGYAQKGELSLVIPICREPQFAAFQRPFQVPEFDDIAFVLPGWKNFVIRRNFVSTDAPYHSENCKYEILLNSEQALNKKIMNVTEKTEFFIKDTGCLFEPRCRELNFTPAFSSELQEFKLLLDFGRTGFCNKARLLQGKREVGSVKRGYSFIPNSYKYSIKNSHGQEIFLIQSQHCVRNNLLCITTNQTFNILSHFEGERRRIQRGRLVRRGGTIYLTFLSDGDSLSKIHGHLLISCGILMDLQINNFGDKKLLQCDFTSCCLQLIASVCFYFLVLLFVLLILFTFVIKTED